MAHLTDTDRVQIETLREAGCLCDVDRYRIKSDKVTIFVGCADGDQLYDLYRHHCHICCGSRHHALLLNGGALLLPRESRIHGAKKGGMVLMNHIVTASHLKGIHSVVLYTHAPCGAAGLVKLSFFDVMRYLAEAKLRLAVRSDLRHLTVSCFCHVDYGGGKKRTYYVHRRELTKFLTEHRRPPRSQYK
jgi:hypothetical protein